MIEVLDLFAGAGGFSLGAHAVTGDVMGIELDDDAVATQSAARMYCVKRDITELDPNQIGKTNENAHLHLHASPPCQTFSAAGRGEGRKHLDTLCQAVRDILAEGFTDIDLAEIPPGAWLVLTPARWIHTIMPDSVSLEQVRAVLPVWEAYAEGMEQLGYFSWTGLLNSEQYGVPQTRTRAWLGASLHKVPEIPKPTHSRYHVRKPERLDEGVLPWVSMAEALGWGMTARGAHTVTAGGTGSGGGAEPFGNGSRAAMAKQADEGHWLTGFPRKADNDDIVTLNGVDYRARDLREDDKPSFVVTEKARSWSHWRQGAQDRATTRPTDQPAGTIAFGNDMAQMRFTDDVDDVGFATESWTHMMQGGAGGEGRPRPIDHPAPTQAAKGTATVSSNPDADWHGKENKARRMAESPATTIQGDSRVWPRGHKINQADKDRLGEEEAVERYGDRAGTTARRVTVDEAGVLQGFASGYPWQGTKTSQFRQVGNAVPPAVAEAVLRSLL